jgi:TATA-box binding protein (TBP) (component of TFIID and TFIIIB)
LEGWTKQIGGEELNLDSISITERQKYNIMPLFPTLIKYMDSLGVVVRTIFFKTSKVRDGNLVVVDSEAKENLESAQKKLLKSFKKILKDEEIVAAYYA